VLAFRLAQERYAVEIAAVREVCPLRSLTPLPGVPPFVMGIVNVRGRVVSVLDLKRFFGLPEAGLSDMNKIVLLQDEHMEFGLLVDAVSGVLTLDSEALNLATLPLNDARLPYLQGVTAEHLILLDARQLLNDPRMIVDQDFE
jgi:purine-binding chemotaxis protein CheW